MKQTTMNRLLTRLYSIVGTWQLSYNYANKEIFGKEGQATMKSLAKYLKAKDYDISYNKAGIACSGEVYAKMMFTDSIGISFTIQQSSFGGNRFNILYRTITHLKDYTGGSNNFMGEEFKDAEKVKQRVYALCKVTENMLISNKAKNSVASPQNINKIVRDTVGNKKLFDEIYKKYQQYFSFGSHFKVNENSHDRIQDLTHATLAYLILVDKQGKYTENNIFCLKIKFASGNVGTIEQLLNCYHNSIWDLFNENSNRGNHVMLDEFVEEEE